MFPSITTAFRTLTIMPFPGKDIANPHKSIPFFPLVGLVLGGMQFVIAKLFEFHPAYPCIPGLIITLFTVVITGALHLDGFADVADGFGGGRSREQILKIFKDSRLGTYGTSALFFNLISRILLVSWLITLKWSILLLFCSIVSRTIVAYGCSLLPYISHTESKSTPFTGKAFPWLLVPISLISITTAVALSGTIATIVIFILSLFTSLLFFLFCIRKIGGITGDCLGAANEIAELTFLVSSCLTASYSLI